MWQTKASDAILASQEIWRLTKIVESPGDIFEQDVSTLAIAIGPDSDIAKVKATYYDPVSPSPLRLAEAIIATGAPFSGRLDALLATPYPNTASGQLLPAFPARVLFSLQDIVDANFLIPFWGAPDDSNVYRAPTKLDLISFVSDPRGIVPDRRPPKQFNFDTAPATGGPNNSINFVIPYFGRRSGSLFVQSLNTPGVINTTDVLVTLTGVSINEGFAPGKQSINFVKELDAVNFSTTGFACLTTRATDDGVWDYLVCTLSGFQVGSHQWAVGDLRIQFNVSDEN